MELIKQAMAGRPTSYDGSDDSGRRHRRRYRHRPPKRPPLTPAGGVIVVEGGTYVNSNPTPGTNGLHVGNVANRGIPVHVEALRPETSTMYVIT